MIEYKQIHLTVKSSTYNDIGLFAMRTHAMYVYLCFMAVCALIRMSACQTFVAHAHPCISEMKK